MSTTIELPPCKHGHDAKYRFINNRGEKACRKCQYENYLRYVAKNKIHRRRYARLYAYVKRGLLELDAIPHKVRETSND